MPLSNGSTYWLFVDNFRIKELNFLTTVLTNAQKRQVIEQCARDMGFDMCGASVRLIRAETSKDYHINGGKLK